MIGVIKNNKHKIIKTIDYPNSLGKVYESITYYLGFNPFTSAGTVMALAALGNYNKKFINNQTYYDIFKKLLKDKKNIYKIDDTWFNYPFTRRGWVSNKFLNIFGKGRSRNAKKHIQIIIKISLLPFKDLKTYI